MMIIIETCPKCGGDLDVLTLTINPPIPARRCRRCGWYWQGKMEMPIRIPFQQPEEVDMENQMKVGEWIPLGHQIGYLKHPWSEDFKCPFCGYEQYTLMSEPPNRCPKCLASLKLKKENETEVEDERTD